MKSIIRYFPTALLLASCANHGSEKPRMRDHLEYQGAICGSLIEGHRWMNGRLSFDQAAEGFVRVTLTDSRGRQVEASWPAWAKDLQSIDSSRIYQVELLTRIYKDPDYVFDDILRVSFENRVIVDASVCHLHQQPMQRQLENGVSACVYPESFFPLQKRKFPNDGNAYLACGSGIRHLNWKCPECYEAYRRWIKQHGIDKDW